MGRLVLPVTHTRALWNFGHAAPAGSVQQGDPLGPLLFRCAVQSLAEEFRAGLDLAVFYLDDGIIAEDITAVGALRLLKHCVGHCRLVHSSRCVPSVQQFDVMVRSCFSSFTGLAGLAVEPEVVVAAAGLGAPMLPHLALCCY